MRPSPHLLLVAALAFAASPFLFSGFSGFDPSQYPIPQDDPPVQPVGWAFSIWGLIYLWLIAHAAFGLLHRSHDDDWQLPRAPLIVSLAVGAVWIPVANLSPIWATLLILWMLSDATIAFLRAPRRDRLWAETPIGLYAGWLTAASAVSLGLLAAGWGLMGPIAAAIVALLLALGMAFAVCRKRTSVGYPLGVGWALMGVAVQNTGDNFQIVTLALAGLATLAVLTARGYAA